MSNSYIAAKAALINLTRQAALELAPHGVRVNAIAPGPFRTNIGAVPGRAAAAGRRIPVEPDHPDGPNG